MATTTKSTKSTTSKRRFPVDWKIKATPEQKKRESFSADDVINAYIRGRKDQNALNSRILNENLNKAMKLSSRFSDMLNEKNIKCKLTLLKPKQITEFESLFVIDAKDYTSPEFEEAYRLTITEKEKANNNTFHFSYIFIPYSKNLSREKLSSNGYVFEYKR